MKSTDREAGKLLDVPRLASSILRCLTDSENRDSILGDYEEIFEEVSQVRGVRTARRWYRSQVFKSFPKFIAGLATRSLMMLKTDFKLALRNILKAKGFSFLNIAGLALGMAVGFLMLLFVYQETSFDQFHEKSGRIYRFSNTVTVEGRQLNISTAPGPFGPLLKETFPEVLNQTRLKFAGSLTVDRKETPLEISKILYAEPSFFEMFTARVLLGEKATMLEAPYSLVLTDETAARLFGRENPVGKIIGTNPKRPYAVTGVIKQMPPNSHLQFDALLSLSTEERANPGNFNWMNRFLITYIELHPKASAADLLPKFQALYKERTPDAIKALNIREVLDLQPLTRIHLGSRTNEEISPPGNPAYVRILALIAAFILLLAGINFVTLSTARAALRAKEVGIRKVLGAERRRLILQFLGESVFLSLISLAAALGLMILLLPLFNHLLLQNLSLRLLQEGAVRLGLLGMALAVGILAGIYPSLVLSGFSPLSTMRSPMIPGRGRSFARNGLVVFQYVVSIALICCTLIVRDQLRFLRNYDLGFERNRLVEIPILGTDKMAAFKAELLRFPGVETAALCGAVPTEVNGETIFTFEGASAGDRQVLPRVDTDGSYLPTVGLKLAEGRDFDQDRPGDRDAAILNETLVRQLGWKSPLGRRIKMLTTNEKDEFIDIPLTVIGVVKDYHFESLHAALRGQVIINRKEDIGRILLRLRAEGIPRTLAGIERLWKSFDSKRPFEYTFLSETFERMYRAEERLGRVLFSFTLLAFFVAGLGLFGLAAFSAERRTKEICIRKVLGASVSGIMARLAGDFLRWVLLANLVAWPAAYLAMQNWRISFPYRAGFNPLLFLAAGAMAAFLAVLTVSLKTAKASRANPVHALRYE